MLQTVTAMTVYNGLFCIKLTKVKHNILPLSHILIIEKNKAVVV